MRHHVTHVRELATAYEILVGRPKGKRHFLDAGIDPRMILKYMYEINVANIVDWTQLLRVMAQ